MATQNVSAAVRRDALSALQLWQTFEYLATQEPPEEKRAEMECVWHLDPRANNDAHMPWHDPAKRDDLTKFFKKAKNYRFQLFAGVIPGGELIDTTRRLLGAPEIDLSEQNDPKNVASFVISLDKNGYVAGDVFVSSVPWAVRCIEDAQRASPDEFFSFSGFFGLHGVEQRIKDKVRGLLLRLQLIEVETEAGIQLKARPLEPKDVLEVAAVVFNECGWSPVGEASWVIKAEQAPEDGEGRQPEDPLNSFFAEDLEKVQGEYASGQAGATLVKFLEMRAHPLRLDLEGDRKHLIDGVHPDAMPAACWPGEYPLVTAQQFAVNAIMRELAEGGLFSVNGPPGTGKTTMLKDIVAAVVCQRAEAMMKFDSPEDAFTTPVVIEADPSDPRFGLPHLLHESLRGFGIVVACSGNVAAENISKELPGKKSIDSAIKLDYFSEVVNSMWLPTKAKRRSDKRWGLISVPLGNSANRSAFTSSFWFGPKKTAEEKADQKKTQDEGERVEEGREAVPLEIAEDSLPLISIQTWVKENRGKVPDWKTARETFKLALDRSSIACAKAARTIRNLQLHQQLREASAKWDITRADIVQNLQQHQLPLKDARVYLHASSTALESSKCIENTLRAVRVKQNALTDQQAILKQLEQRKPEHSSAEVQEKINQTDRSRDRVHQELQAMEHVRPSWLRSLMRPSAAKDWEGHHAALMEALKNLREMLDVLDRQETMSRKWETDRNAIAESLNNCLAEVTRVKAEAIAAGLEAGYTLEEAEGARRSCEVTFQGARNYVNELQHEAGQLEVGIEIGDRDDQLVQQKLGACLKVLDGTGLLESKQKSWHLREFSRDDFHQASPYQDSPDIFAARRELFVAAMDLHKAFIVHSWKRLRPTLNAMVGMLSGQIRPNNVHAGPMALWDALFLIVPVVSTTFASFPRLFRGVGREGLAWVLIDEAGQAAPQACVGALWRAKRAVIVGDPLQLEPVISVPKELVWPLQDRCGTPGRYVPPTASVQTIADFSNQFGTYIKRGESEDLLWLGAPLVVHRRCVEPMFGIANTIAYDGKMVYGAGKAPPYNEIPCSRWIDVPAGGADEHWIPAQGEIALAKVRELVGDRPEDDDGQPLVYVITPFKSVAHKMRELLRRKFNWDWKVVERLCGTVHTFQGKEARDVILLLGGNPAKPGVIAGFAGKNPNLVNVAVTRAKQRLYVIGDRKFWDSPSDTKGFYRSMAATLDSHVAATSADHASSPL